MRKEKIELDELDSILSNIDFSRDNPLWKELNVINSDGKISARADERKIANYFKGINIS